MAKRTLTLDLDADADEARGICVGAFRELGWSVTGDGGGPIRADEDLGALHCHCPPAQAVVALSSGEAGTRVELEVKVPAWGIVSSHQVRDRSALIARQIAATKAQSAARLSPRSGS